MAIVTTNTTATRHECVLCVYARVTAYNVQTWKRATYTSKTRDVLLCRKPRSHIESISAEQHTYIRFENILPQTRTYKHTSMRYGYRADKVPLMSTRISSHRHTLHTNTHALRMGYKWDTHGNALRCLETVIKAAIHTEINKPSDRNVCCGYKYKYAQAYVLCCVLCVPTCTHRQVWCQHSTHTQ